jgi:hypothetical protein
VSISFCASPLGIVSTRNSRHASLSTLWNGHGRSVEPGCSVREYLPEGGDDRLLLGRSDGPSQEQPPATMSAPMIGSQLPRRAALAGGNWGRRKRRPGGAAGPQGPRCRKESSLLARASRAFFVAPRAARDCVDPWGGLFDGWRPSCRRVVVRAVTRSLRCRLSVPQGLLFPAIASPILSNHPPTRSIRAVLGRRRKNRGRLHFHCTLRRSARA